MPRCEDFPCCGHEAGCCPNYDAAGWQTDMVCTCGTRLPISNRFSICNNCRWRGIDQLPPNDDSSFWIDYQDIDD